MSFETHLLCTLDNIKLYHWQTKSYARHKETDQLWKKLSSLVDDLVETFYGAFPGRVKVTDEDNTLHVQNWTDDEAFQTLTDFSIWIKDTLSPLLKDNTDLLHIRDDMLTAVNHALYMFSFT